MKQLAGAEPDRQVDYEKQTINELEKVQSKAILLNDMLDNAKEGEKIGLEGDVYDQVAAACRGARPKIQKWIEEDTGEHEGFMDRLLLCNDLINNALERFEACKRGDWTAAQAAVDNQAGAGKKNDLISFDGFADDDNNGGVALPSGDDAAASSSNPGFTAGGLPLDLFAPSPSASPAPGPSAPQGQKTNPMAFFNTQPQQPQPPQYGQQQFGGLGSLQQPQQQQAQQYGQQQPAGFGGFQQQPQQWQQPQQPQQQWQQPAPSAQGYSVPPSNGQPQQPQPQQPQQQQSAQPKKDAFADLVDLL